MSSRGLQLSGRKGLVLFKVLITTNFVLFLLLISPLGRSRQLYTAIRNAGFGALAATALQLWIALTTLIATALYFWRRFRKPDAAEQSLRKKSIDGVLLLAWWIVLIVTCLYAFMMGLGG